jgi:hypothetical protein
VIAALITLAVLAAAQVPQPAVVWAVGDGADGSAQAKALARTIERDKPARFLYLGDVYERGTRAEFARNYDGVYGALAPITSPTPGNHDWPQRAQGYLPYWQGKTGQRMPSWYSIEVGGWQILSLNSEADHGAGSRQLRWLRRQLAAPGDCRIAFWHRPRFSAGTVHGDAPDVAPLWNAVRGHAALVLNGHEHDLQHLRRSGGTVELVAGAGGRARYPLRGGDRRLLWGRDDVNGALRLELDGDTARFEFRAANGRALHAGSVRCQA